MPLGLRVLAGVALHKAGGLGGGIPFVASGQ